MTYPIERTLMRSTSSLRLRLLAALTGMSACGALMLVAAGSANATPTSTAAHASHAPRETVSTITNRHSHGPRPAISGGDGSCETNTVFGLVLKGNYRATGNAYTFDCIDAAACSQTAVIQYASPQSPGDFVTLVDGPITDGCAKADESIAVSAVCKLFKGEDWEYRTAGIYSVVWADGDLSQAVYYSPVFTTQWAC
jgi:hypothetical protein